MPPVWRIHDMAVERVQEAWTEDIGSIFLDGFGLPEERAWKTDRIAAALGSISYLALAYAADGPSDRSPCGYAMYTVLSAFLGNDTNLLWQDAICLRRSVQRSGAPRGQFATIAARCHLQPIGWIGGRTQSSRVIRAYCRLGHAFPFAEDYSTPAGQAVMSFLRAKVREVSSLEHLDSNCGIARAAYSQGRLNDDEDSEDTSDIERQLTAWGLDRDRGDAVIVAVRLHTPFPSAPNRPK